LKFYVCVVDILEFVASHKTRWPWQRKSLWNVWHHWSSCYFCHLWEVAVEQWVSVNFSTLHLCVYMY